MRKNKLYTSKKDNAIDDNGKKSLTNAIFSNIQVSNDSESHNKPKNEEYNNRKRNEQPSMLSPAVSTPKVQKKRERFARWHYMSPKMNVKLTIKKLAYLPLVI